MAASALSSIRRGWRLIASLVALTLTLACAVIPLIPRQYSATALVYPNLFSGEQGKVVPLGSIDAASLVTSEARLIVSDAVLQAVVKHLELDLNPEVVGARSWVPTGLDWIRAMLFPETRNHSAFDRQVSLLRNKVEVVKDTRSYLISISFTARSADEAARIVNAIALEYLRDKKILRGQSAVSAAQGELWRQLAIYGEKHPKVLQSADGLESARAALQAAMSTANGSPDAHVTDEGVKLATPNRTPTSPKGFVILAMAFMLSLLAGIGLAVWRDRLGFEPRRLLLGLLSSDLRSRQRFIGGLIGRSRSTSFLCRMPLFRRLRVGLASLAQRALEILHLGGRRNGNERRQQEISPVVPPAER